MKKFLNEGLKDLKKNIQCDPNSLINVHLRTNKLLQCQKRKKNLQ